MTYLLGKEHFRTQLHVVSCWRSVYSSRITGSPHLYAAKKERDVLIYISPYESKSFTHTQ